MKQHNDPTVEVAYDENGKLIYRCLYCGEWYPPTKRWVQKYCTPSCTVKACRERKDGFYGVTGGTLLNKRNATTNKDLQNALIAFIQKYEHQQEMDKIHRAHDNEMRQLEFKELRHQMEIDMQKIISKQNWHMFLTVIIPFIAPLLSSWAAGLFNKAETAPLDVNSFLKKLDDDFGDRVTPEMKAQIILAMGNIF